MMYVANFQRISDHAWDEIRRSTEDGYERLCRYDEIKLPTRATKDSAGFDFYMTEDISLKSGKSIVINTGVRCKIDPGWMLMLCPKSGLGFKFHMSLANTVGIVDGDYYNTHCEGPSDEGHIMVKIYNGGEYGKEINLKKGDKFCQGIFLQYGLAYTTDTEYVTRNGGFGSTGR